MCQIYHQNARTNQYSRKIIQESYLSNVDLSKRFNISIKTTAKWKHRGFSHDKSSRPKNITRALSDTEREVIRVIRRLTWVELDNLVDTVKGVIPKVNRSNVYRTLLSFGMNRVPDAKRAEAKRFKEYEPGYLHIDVTYLPKINGQKYYLFVAIDRATRLMYYQVYEAKIAVNSVDFVKECKDFFPFYISHILSDNGLEFTDKFVQSNKQPSGKHKFDELCAKNEIDHRLTKPATPKTNGMVERANGTIKAATIKATTYKSVDDMRKDLAKFLVFYNVSRRHGGLQKE